jgi:aldehyde:ferredoxin oxidoreductase
MAGPYRLNCLFIDMRTGEGHLETLDEDMSRAWIGGRGMGAYFLGQRPKARATGGDNPLVLASGPLAGSRIPSSGRLVISAFSPLTETVCSSTVGGGFALEMKRAGIDAIHVTGRAPARSMVFVDERGARMERDPFPDDMALGEMYARLGRSGWSLAAVGEAAVKGCLYASIMVDGSFASGRGGLGLVMAGKNLRAIAVKGTGEGLRASMDPAAEARACSDIVRLFDASPFIMGRSGIGACGTGALVDLMAERRMMPTANFRKTYFEGYRAFCACAIKRAYKPRHHPCTSCPAACRLKAQVPVPEYNSLAHFGALNENDDLPSIVEANLVCNEKGMDTISAASTIACLAEIRGRRFRGGALVDMVRQVTEDSPLGELLRQGSLRMAGALGSPGTSMSVKGLEIPAFDPRGAYGTALAYGTSTRGACHLRAHIIACEVLRRPVAADRFSFEGKARMVKIAEDICAAADTIGACRFAFVAATLEEYANGLAAVTGIPFTQGDLMKTGEAVCCLELRINEERGFSRQDDMLPERFYLEKGTPGPDFETPPIDRSAYEKALDRYHRIRSGGVA